MVKNILLILIIFLALKYFLSDDNVYQGTVTVKDNSTCKNRDFIADKPIRVYRFYEDNSFKTALLPYYSEPLDDHKIPEKDQYDYDYTVKIYPAFTKYKIGKIYGKCSFESGCFDDFRLEAEDGLKIWISVMDMDLSKCTLKSGFVYDVDTTVDDRNASTYKATIKKDKIVQKTPVSVVDYWKDLKFIKDFFNDHNQTQQNGNDQVVLEMSVGNQYNELYYIHYMRNVVEKYFPKDFNGSMHINFTKHIKPPTLKSGTKFLHPYSCKEALYDPYACFRDLDRWLKKPYEMKGYFSDFENERKVVGRLKKDEKYILLNLTFSEIDFDKFKRLPLQIKKIYELLGRNITIVIQFNDEMHEGIYVKDKTKTYERLHLMSQKKFMRVLQKYHYLRSN